MRGIGRLRAAILRYRSGRTTVSASTRLTPSIAETTSKTPRGTLYRGREGMWSWVLHRITGIAIFFFLLVHVLDTSLGETVLVAAIVFHALNGLRIILIDVWSKGAQYQKQMFWIVIGLWLVLLAGFVPRHLINVFSHVGGAS